MLNQFDPQYKWVVCLANTYYLKTKTNKKNSIKCLPRLNNEPRHLSSLSSPWFPSVEKATKFYPQLFVNAATLGEESWKHWGWPEGRAHRSGTGKYSKIWEENLSCPDSRVCIHCKILSTLLYSKTTTINCGGVKGEELPMVHHHSETEGQSGEDTCTGAFAALFPAHCTETKGEGGSYGRSKQQGASQVRQRKWGWGGENLSFSLRILLQFPSSSSIIYSNKWFLEQHPDCKLASHFSHQKKKKKKKK